MPRVTKCHYCPAAVIWLRTSKGKMMPVDAETVPDGPEPIFDSKAGHVSHFVTCTKGKELSGSVKCIQCDRRFPADLIRRFRVGKVQSVVGCPLCRHRIQTSELGVDTTPTPPGYDEAIEFLRKMDPDADVIEHPKPGATR